MDDLAKVLVNFTTAFVSVWIVNRYLNIFFEKKKYNVINVVIWSLFGIYQILIGYYSGNASIWIFLLNVILVSLIASTSFKQVRNKKIFYVVLLFLFWMFVEIFCYFFLKLLPVGNKNFGTLGNVVSKLFTIIFVEMLNIKFNSKEKKSISTIYYLLLLFIPLGSAYIAHNIFILETNNHNIVTMVTFTILLIINLIIFEIYRKLAASFIIQKENLVYEQQMELLSRNTEEQKKAMEDFYEEKHNLINKLIVLKESVINNQKEDAISYLDQLIQTSSTSSERISNVGNNVVDAIINFKYSLAKEQGIGIKLKIFIPEELPIQQCDLGIILGNSLDNAIEATSRCENQEKIINICMGLKRDTLLLAISNPYKHTLKKDRHGNLRTTKVEDTRHGYGMSSIRKVAEKYQGDIIIDAQDGIFSLTVIMKI